MLSVHTDLFFFFPVYVATVGESVWGSLKPTSNLFLQLCRCSFFLAFFHCPFLDTFFEEPEINSYYSIVVLIQVRFFNAAFRKSRSLPLTLVAGFFIYIFLFILSIEPFYSVIKG